MRSPLTSIAAFALLGAVLGLVRWSITPDHASGDAFWYGRNALELAGWTEDQATRLAAEFIVREGRGTDPAAYVTYAENIDPRYPAIFASRPVYPLIVAAFLWTGDLRTAMALGALLAAAFFAAVFGWFVQWLTGSTSGAVGAVTMAFALPSGEWFAFMYADGWMLALWALALTLACRYLVDPRLRYLAGTIASLAVLYLTKPANGAVLAIVFAILGAGAFALRSPGRRQAAVLAAAGAAVGVTHLAALWMLGLPGFETTLQDLFTVHFAQPDIGDPLGRLFQRDVEVVVTALTHPVREPVTWLLIVVLLTPLVIAKQPWAAAWLVAGLASSLVVLAHPVTAEFPRLLAPIWISAALGAGWLFSSIAKRRSNGSSLAPQLPN